MKCSTCDITSKEEHYKNLYDLTKKGIKLKDLIAVRSVFNNNLNKEGDKFYAGPYRPTIHFSLNHYVEEHMWGDWKDADTVVLTPLRDIIENNPENFFGGSTVDSFCVGYAKMPDCEILKKEKDEGDCEFINRVNEKIKDLGYKVVPGGMWAWGGSWSATEQFQKILEDELKNYFFSHHSNSLFGSVDNSCYGISSDYFPENETNKRRYMIETSKNNGLENNIFKVRKDGKIYYTGLNTFYLRMKKGLKKEIIQRDGTIKKEKAKEIEKYEDWLYKNFGGNDFENFREADSNFYRVFWIDMFKSKLSDKISFLNKKINRIKETGVNMPYEKRELKDNQMYKDNYESFNRFIPYLNNWLMYWNNKK